MFETIINRGKSIIRIEEHLKVGELGNLIEKGKIFINCI